MKTQKLSFKNIKDELSRDEMKEIMAGSGNGYGIFICCSQYIDPFIANRVSSCCYINYSGTIYCC